MTHCLALLSFVAILSTVAVASEDSAVTSTNVNDTGKLRQYRFQYYVKDDATGDFKTQEETRSGSSVRGSYSVAEPNGNLRTVTYTAGGGRGFEAVVDVRRGASPMAAHPQGNTPRVLNPVMSMMAPQRYPRPKKPMGNDIGMARVLESNVQHIPGGYVMGISSKPPTDDLETSVSVDFSKALEEPGKAEEPVTLKAVTEKIDSTSNVTEDEVKEEIKEVFDAMPKMPELALSGSAPHLTFHKDKEEAIIDERITEVARQLAETSLRREFEEKKLGHNLPISLKQYGQNRETKPKLTLRKDNHLGKAFEFPANTLPLVSRFPPETAQLQLISEVQSIPQPIYKEGFYPVTPAPEFSGPLLGGPPLRSRPESDDQDAGNSLPEKSKSDKASENRKPEGKSLNLDSMPIVGIPRYLRLEMPNFYQATGHQYPIFLNLHPLKYNQFYQYVEQQGYPPQVILRTEDDMRH